MMIKTFLLLAAFQPARGCLNPCINEDDMHAFFQRENQQLENINEKLEKELAEKDELIKTMKVDKDAVLKEVKKLAGTPNSLDKLVKLVEKSLEEKEATSNENPFTLDDVKKVLSLWKSHNTTVMVQECINLAEKLQAPEQPNV